MAPSIQKKRGRRRCGASGCSVTHWPSSSVGGHGPLVGLPCPSGGSTAAGKRLTSFVGGIGARAVGPCRGHGPADTESVGVRGRVCIPSHGLRVRRIRNVSQGPSPRVCAVHHRRPDLDTEDLHHTKSYTTTSHLHCFSPLALVCVPQSLYPLLPPPWGP